MQPDDRDKGFLLDMLSHARGAITALAGRTFDDYMADNNLRLATERRIEIIGEAARRISPAFQAAHPEIPWSRITAQRNVLIHEYGEVDDELVYRLIQDRLPELIDLLSRLASLPPTDDDTASKR